MDTTVLEPTGTNLRTSGAVKLRHEHTHTLRDVQDILQVLGSIKCQILSLLHRQHSTSASLHERDGEPQVVNELLAVLGGLLQLLVCNLQPRSRPFHITSNVAQLRGHLQCLRCVAPALVQGLLELVCGLHLLLLAKLALASMIYCIQVCEQVVTCDTRGMVVGNGGLRHMFTYVQLVGCDT